MSDSRLRHELHYGDRMMRCFADRPSNLEALFQSAVARRPDGLALVAGDVRQTYRALAGDVERVASNLDQRGFKQGERVGLLVGNRPEFLVVTLAASRLGMVIVPIDIRQRRPEIYYMLEHCQAAVLIYDEELEDELPNSSELPFLRARFAVGGNSPRASATFAELLGPAAAPVKAALVAEEDPFCILYTSGTTGRPKGAILTHLGVVHSVMHFELGLGLQEGEIGALAVPAAHVTGLVAILLTMVRVAGTTVMMRAFRARDYLATVERDKISYALLVPAMYNLCLLDKNIETWQLSSWRVGGYGGAPMPQATIRRLAELLPTLAISNVYGATETTSPVSILPPAEALSRADSVGRTLPCADVIVVDPQGREVEPGELGELMIAGPMTIPGYWNGQEANAASFAGGYWRSGDIGSLDADGYLRIHDRMKDVINRGGYKIYCIEVENVITNHPGVVECAVVGYPDDVLGERVHAFILPSSGAELSLESIRSFCSTRLSDYKLPEKLTLLQGGLPRNSNGKIVKASLRRTAEGA